MLMMLTRCSITVLASHLSLLSVSPRKHGRPVSNIRATRDTIASWYGLWEGANHKKNIFTSVFLARLDFNMLLDCLKNPAPFFSPKSIVTCLGARLFPRLGQATRIEC